MGESANHFMECPSSTYSNLVFSMYPSIALVIWIRDDPRLRNSYVWCGHIMVLLWMKSSARDTISKSSVRTLWGLESFFRDFDRDNCRTKVGWKNCKWKANIKGLINGGEEDIYKEASYSEEWINRYSHTVNKVNIVTIGNLNFSINIFRI